MEKYTIGIDFGTLSGRAVVVSAKTGAVVASSEYKYKNAVIDRCLPESGVPLGADWALQDPDDYIAVLRIAVPDAVKKSGISKDDIIGIGIDTTGCTLLPVREDLTPLCKIEGYRDRPNAWVKLWKHHAAQPQAEKLNRIAEQRGEEFLKWYGGKISSEWFVPKVMQIVEEDPDIYKQANYFMEISEWIIAVLTGRVHRNTCAAGYKCLWSPDDGYPSNDFFAALNPEMENFVQDKLATEIIPIGGKVGGLCETAAELTGLNQGIAVAPGLLDAHACIPGMGITKPGEMMMVMGTSLCHIFNGEQKVLVDGICGCIRDGAIPGSYQYETGQPASGDILDWFVSNFTPSSYHEQAKKENLNIYAYLDKLASEISPGTSGLVALDWWNGNRSTLVDANLTGLLIGMTLATRPEEIYRALVEASAFGTRYILEACKNSGVEIDSIFACGGLSYKSPFWVQLFADVLNRPISVSAEKQTSAIGAAIAAAVAAGKSNGGYDNFDDACDNMKAKTNRVYKPGPANKDKYNSIYPFYKELYELFGKSSDIMKRLKESAQA